MSNRALRFAVLLGLRDSQGDRNHLGVRRVKGRVPGYIPSGPIGIERRYQEPLGFTLGQVALFRIDANSDEADFLGATRNGAVLQPRKERVMLR